MTPSHGRVARCTAMWAVGAHSVRRVVVPSCVVFPIRCAVALRPLPRAGQCDRRRRRQPRCCSLSLRLPSAAAYPRYWLRPAFASMLDEKHATTPMMRNTSVPIQKGPELVE